MSDQPLSTAMLTVMYPPARHDCWPQTIGFVGFHHVHRCACGAIRMPMRGDDGPWMQKNANLDPKHTIYSDDYYPPDEAEPMPVQSPRGWLRRVLGKVRAA